MDLHEQFFQNLRDYFFITAFALAIAAFIFIIFFLRQKKASSKQSSITKTTSTPSVHIITSQDIRAIAGEDMITTQLDLARAYIEIGKKQLARKILDHASKQGNLSQRQAALQLLKNLQ